MSVSNKIRRTNFGLKVNVSSMLMEFLLRKILYSSGYEHYGRLGCDAM